MMLSYWSYSALHWFLLYVQQETSHGPRLSKWNALKMGKLNNTTDLTSFFFLFCYVFKAPSAAIMLFSNINKMWMVSRV